MAHLVFSQGCGFCNKSKSDWGDFALITDDDLRTNEDLQRRAHSYEKQKGVVQNPSELSALQKRLEIRGERQGAFFFSLYFLKSVLEIKEPTDLLQSLAHNSRI